VGHNWSVLRPGGKSADELEPSANHNALRPHPSPFRRGDPTIHVHACKLLVSIGCWDWVSRTAWIPDGLAHTPHLRSRRLLKGGSLVGASDNVVVIECVTRNFP
jgi:hypothetical protein